VSSMKDCKTFLTILLKLFHLSIALWMSWRCLGVATLSS
jgi:hypothetical protein